MWAIGFEHADDPAARRVGVVGVFVTGNGRRWAIAAGVKGKW